MIVEVVSAHSRRTDRFAKPGEYAEAGIGIYWRVETEPVVALHAFVLRDGTYVPAGPDDPPVPWGRLQVDVSILGRL